MEEATTYGERLLRSPAAMRAADAVEAEVHAQLDAALHGPLGTALAGQAAHADPAGRPPGARAATGADTRDTAAASTAAAAALLNTAVPRRFIAAGACLSAAHAALAAGDEARVAGALLCAQRFLFPNDPAGADAVARAVAIATRHLATYQASEPSGTPPIGAGTEQVEATQRAVAAGGEALERAYQAAIGHIQAATLGTRSWLSATGGLGAGSAAGQTQFGPFLDGLIRWAFFTAAALQGVRADDWSRTGAALVAARQYVSSAA